MALLQRLIAFNDQLIYRGRVRRVANGWDWISRRCLEDRCGRCQKIWSACRCLGRGGTNWERWSSTSSITLPADERRGRHRQAVSERPRVKRTSARWRWGGLAATICGAAVVTGVVLGLQGGGPAALLPSLPTTSPTPHNASGSIIGVFHRGAPQSYAGVTAFTKATGVSPRLVSYYSGWLEPFQVGFAAEAARHGALPLVQIDPTQISLAAIAARQYDDYLRSYADAVRSFGHKVILSFGPEMNGNWYSWGYKHTPAKVFVAAWRHIVDVFRRQGAHNVIWMWTVNIIHPGGSREIANPARWWPGRSYVTWIGMDGYYYKPSWTFAPLFGPTIKILHTLSRVPIPILISETGAPTAYQPAKIADLFAGIRAYGLLGFVWFDANHVEDWSLSTPAAIAAFRRGVNAVNDLAP
jgi:mannan endo-1,4-beta-mannosidase